MNRIEVVVIALCLLLAAIAVSVIAADARGPMCDTLLFEVTRPSGSHSTIPIPVYKGKPETVMVYGCDDGTLRYFKQ